MWDLCWTNWRWGTFPLPIFIPPISPQSPSSIIRGWYNRPVVAAVPSGLSLTTLTIINIHIAEDGILQITNLKGCLRKRKWPDYKPPRYSFLKGPRKIIKISAENLPRGIGRESPKADNFTAICEPIV
jgi:hypothetical protein